MISRICYIDDYLIISRCVHVYMGLCYGGDEDEIRPPERGME